MVAMILVSTLFVGAVALIVVCYGNFRVERMSQAVRPNKPVPTPLEIRLIPRRSLSN